MKKYFLFDLDGTITDSMTGIVNSIKFALRSVNFDIEKAGDLQRFIGPPLRYSFTEYCGFDAEKTEAVVRFYRKYYADRGMHENTLYQGIDTVIKNLHQKGAKIVLATSKALFYAEKILAKYDLLKYFDFLGGAELGGGRSQKDEVIQYALYGADIDRIDDAIMIGDRKHDIIGAKKFGMQAVGVLYGYGSADELIAAGADYTVQDTDQLNKLLLGLAEQGK